MNIEMDSLERELREAVAEKKLPGVLLAAANIDDTFNYAQYFGNASIKPGAEAVSESTTFCVASATKLVTSVAAMQCVERGLIGLDTDVSIYLPELKDAKIFEGVDNGKPILKTAQNKITLSRLLSHTSGFGSLECEKLMEYYGALGDPKADLLMRYFMTEDEDVKSKALPEVQQIMNSLVVEPLLFEPGTDWTYGLGPDWAGQLVEKLTHQSLESYCQANIFSPLSMKNTTFRPGSYPHVAEKLMEMTAQTRDGGLEIVPSIYSLTPALDLGGSGLYTSAGDYIAILKSLLRNNGKILKPETVDLMLGYRIPDENIMKSPKIKEFFGDEVEKGMEFDHCLCGLVNLRPLKTGRAAGGVQWGGATRCFWWIDRAGGICGFYGSQIIGPKEKLSLQMYKKFQSAVYATQDEALK